MGGSSCLPLSKTSVESSSDGVRRLGVMSRGVNRCEMRDSRTSGEEVSLLPLVTAESSLLLYLYVDLIELTRVLLFKVRSIAGTLGCEHDVSDRGCFSPFNICLLSAQFSYYYLALNTYYAFEAST